MAEARDPLTPDREARTTPHTASPEVTGRSETTARTSAASSDYEARDKDSRDIERDIDHTRAEMSETLDAIGARLQPDYIKEQAKDAFRSTARDTGTTMLDTIKENPVPSLIAGLSIGWLVAKSGDSGRDRGYGARYDEDYYRRYGRYPEYRTDYETYRTGYESGYAREDDQSLKDRAGDVTHQAREKAGEAKERASRLAGRATDQVQHAADDARTYGRRAEGWLERQMNESPLVMGAVTLAAGALVGLAVPETRKEDEWMGRRSEQFKHQARDAAEEKIDQAKRVADATVDEAKEKAKEVAETAKDEAKQQNLDEPPQAAGSDGRQSGASTGRGTQNVASSSPGGPARS